MNFLAFRVNIVEWWDLLQKLRNKEPHILYSLLKMVRNAMGGKFIALWRQEKSYKILVGMPEEKTPIRRHRRKSYHYLKY
jgi:hypothetical protein